MGCPVFFLLELGLGAQMGWHDRTQLMGENGGAICGSFKTIKNK